MSVSFSARSVRGRGSARLTAGTLVSGLVATTVLAGAGAAAADGDGATVPGHTGRGGATATVAGLKTSGAAVIHGATGDQQVSAGLFEMSVEGGGTLQTYCVDINTPTQKDAKYHETAWSGTSLGTNKDAGRIRWILQHSYPQVNDLAALAKKAGIRGQLTEQDAAAGTQVAIWRHSDDVDVDAVDPQAEQLADYLQKNARNQAEPKASLTLDPPTVSGRPGARIGPVTVRTDARSVTIVPPADATASGVRIVDKDGEPLTTATNGSEFFYEVPEDASAATAEVTAQASTTVPVGRAFVSDSRSQTQILAGSSESTVSATATATWALEGAIPALSARENCAKGGVDLTVTNHDDEPFTFELTRTEHTVAGGASRTVTVPLSEDRAYDFTVTGPNGFGQRFTGMLDCLTRTAETGTTAQSYTAPTPLAGAPADTNLAETGSSNATPWIAGTAIALVVLGGAGLVITRRRQTPTDD
ncbi:MULTISPECIES: Cys-Gln thioester bond-forming surface protein [unclassified Streptomyces]|uniref:Cys-Gln thioester bond-forming surface protein n=1 Tax=unclassified Streptomyces TaxID=2593676 RepID=UPI000F6F658F|nr:MULTISPECIES: Cys-Gln thioester bond-forming surface protein [unclassified Streptomyces]AZM62249.1 peptidase [Streptomyces sp. WAC 01438]RSM96269.1 peptidase [Streptomyces sp. WAC 01420]